MGHFIDQLELPVRVRNTLKLAGIASRTDFLAITQEAYRAMPNAILKGWPEILEMQAILLALPGIDTPKPTSDVNVQSVYAYIVAGIDLLGCIEDSHGNDRDLTYTDVFVEGTPNIKHLEIHIQADPPSEEPTTDPVFTDEPVFRITVERIS